MSKTNKLIDQLTPEQEKQMIAWRDKHLAIGRSTAPLDIKKTRQAINFAYNQLNKKPPFIWYCHSPLQLSLIVPIVFKLFKNTNLSDNLDANLYDNLRANLYDNLGVNLGASLDVNLRDNLYHNLGASLDGSLRANLGGNLDGSLRDNLYHNLGASLDVCLRANLDGSLGASLDGNLNDNLRDNLGVSLDVCLGANLRGSLGDSLNDNLRDNLGVSLDVCLRANLDGSLGASLDGNLFSIDLSEAKKVWSYRSSFCWWWIGWYAYAAFPVYFLDCSLSPEKTVLLDNVFNMLSNTHIFLMLPNICFISERPTKLNIDESGRLHSASEAALQYADGYGFYAWHGVRLPAYIIEEPGKITVELIEKEQNAEVRRVMIERYGQSRYLLDSGALKIHEDDFGVLYRKDIPDDESMVFVKVVNSTAEPDGSYKDYWLRVPPHITSAKEAVAWTFDVPKENYQLIKQT
jgi:hypothetical protein